MVRQAHHERNASRFIKRTASVWAAAALACLAAVTAGAGSSSTSLTVSATVSINCTISATTLAFGVYDPVVTHATSNLDGTGSLTVACTKGAVTTIGLNLGANASGSTRRMTGAGDYLTYELYKDSARTLVWGNSGGDLLDTGIAPSKAPRTFTVYGRVPAGQDVPAGAYVDTVTATVNF